ncbi:hypothetical protein CBR_g3525 [Chara braunii]|uniref:Uncharacterized protein n=1 Tax=Chara braunii TaxID=69332 RepID=A0A388KFL7_CHABU|nr:hypothetical protein CBR_g3525 [Chara braunii]|eukprot:GBG68831.1 hypothetical protein CBR_g3525 [Chara braunii]
MARGPTTTRRLEGGSVAIVRRLEQRRLLRFKMAWRRGDWRLISDSMLDKGREKLTTMMSLLSSHPLPGLEVDWGVTSVIGWVEATIHCMLVVMEPFEEGPALELDAYIDWQRANALWSDCRQLLAEAHVRGAELIRGLQGAGLVISPSSSTTSKTASSTAPVTASTTI